MNDIKKIHVSKLQRKVFWSAFLTATFTEFISVIALAIDSLIVCNFLGENEIAAVGIASPFFFLSGIPATCLSAGLQTMCTQKMGCGKIEEVNQCFKEVITFTSYLMIVITAIVYIAAPQLAFLFGANGNSANLSGLTVTYLHGLAFDAAPYVLMSVIIPVVILDNGNRTVIISSVAGGIVNIVFDMLTVKQNWGLLGIGLSSALAAFVSLCILLTHFLGKNHIIHFGFAKIHLNTIFETIHLGEPNAFHSISGTLRAAFLNSIVVKVGGSIGMSVLTIHGTITDFIDIIFVGIAGATGVLSGIAYGEKNGEDIEKTNKLTQKYIFIVSVIGMLILILFRNTIAHMFLDIESNGYQLLLFAITCIACGLFFNAEMYARVSYLQAVKQVQSARNLEITANLFIFFVLIVIMGYSFGVKGIFVAFPVSKLIALLVHFSKYSVKTRKLIPSVPTLLELDENFFTDVKDMISYSFKNEEECVLSAEQIHLFCKGHQLSQKTAHMASLCAEEIMMNIISHSGTIQHRIEPEIRVTIADGKLIMHIRDCGTAFNISSLAKSLADTEEQFKNIGLKLICKSADEISYYRIYGMNMTIIKI